MKVFMFECDESELKANKGVMDILVDNMRQFCDAFYGSCYPKTHPATYDENDPCNDSLDESEETP